MKKRMKFIIITVLVILLMLSGNVMASSNAMYNGILKAISFGQYVLGDGDEPENDPAIVIETTIIYLEAGETTMLQYYTVPDTITDEDLIFASDDENVVTIAPGGLVTAIGTGEATITITLQDDETVQATCFAYIVSPEIIIQELTTTPETLVAGEEGQINVSISAQGFENEQQLDITILKNDEDVTDNFAIEGNEVQSNEVNLTITPNTELVTSGEYTLLVSHDGKTIKDENIENQTRTFVITGNNPVTGIEVDRTYARMQVGETKTIQVTVSPENADNPNLIWTSNNEEVATVDEQGIITAVAKGTAIITVASDENTEISQTIDVTVQELVESEEYVIDNDTNIISYIPENTTVQSFLNNVSVGADEYQVLNANGEELEADNLVGTGTVLIIGNAEYTLIVTGDTNGDGQITITDVSQVKLHFIGLELLSGIQLQAADTNHDGDITITDVSQIKLHFIGLELIQNERPSNNEEEQLEED